MSTPIPQKTALNVFPYTRNGFSIIDVVPFEASYSKIFRAGMLARYLTPTAQNTSYFDNYATDGKGVSLVKSVDLTKVVSTDAADQDFAGIIAHSFPENRPQLGDEYGDLVVENRDLAPHITTIAGPMARTSMAQPGSGGLILARFASAGAAAVLTVADINKPVYVSRTVAAHVGLPGYATVDDLSDDAGSIRIGMLIELPIVDGEWGHIRFETPIET